jgi:hypothetical protein
VFLMSFCIFFSYPLSLYLSSLSVIYSGPVENILSVVYVTWPSSSDKLFVTDGRAKF